MASVDARRSQMILRIPVDQVAATLTLHDGERIEAQLFVRPGEDVAAMLASGPMFVPVRQTDGIRLIARAAIACMCVAAYHHRASDLPEETQKAKIKLRSGAVIEGELRFIAPPGQRRTVDHLNDTAEYLALHAIDTTTYIVKHHIAWVEEA